MIMALTVLKPYSIMEMAAEILIYAPAVLTSYVYRIYVHNRACGLLVGLPT